MTLRSFARRIGRARLIAISLFTLFACSAITHAQNEPDTVPPIGTGALDGRIYVGTVWIKEDSAGTSEEKIVFQRGRFKSFAFEAIGEFPVADYTTEKKGKDFSFHAEAESGTVGRMVWSGTVSADSLHATAIWYKTAADTLHVKATCWVQEAVDPLNKQFDGMTITGTLHEVSAAGDTIREDEELTFAKGEMSSKSSNTRGFHPNRYYVNPRYDTLYFIATLNGPQHAERRWRGWLVGKKMEAQLEWDKGDGSESLFEQFIGTVTAGAPKKKE